MSISSEMTNEEAVAIRRRFAAINYTDDERDAIHECYMQGVNHDCHVWVTWTDVQKLLCALNDCAERRGEGEQK